MKYTLENDDLKICVCSRGAELSSVIKKETGEEMLWTADPEIWGRHAPILFPYCGRLKNGRFMHDGVVYEGGQHGFARDLEHAPVEQGEDFITLCLEANAVTMEKFPFAFKLFSTFRLEGKTVHHEIRVENDSDEVMPFAFGYHPGFLCPFDAQHRADDYMLRFSAPQSPAKVQIGEDNLLTGTREPCFENQTEIPVHDGAFDAGCICLTDLTCETLSLTERDSGRSVDVRIEGFPYVLLWSPEGPVRFVCIEPWHGVPDAQDATGIWAEKADTVQLKPETSWNTCMDITFNR